MGLVKIRVCFKEGGREKVQYKFFLKVDENYDPTEFFSGIGGGDHNGQANGNGAHPDPSDRLQDDLAVSDDSEDEKDGTEEEGVDPMAF